MNHFSILSLHHFLLLGAAVAFLPADDLLLNCGGNSTITIDDGRFFQPDNGGSSSSFFYPISKNVARVRSSDLYGSARIFFESAEYRFNIAQPGRHFLRLHFFPLRGSQYDFGSAIFSVFTDGFTLLRNFSFLRPQLVIKEYAIYAGFDMKLLTLRLVPFSGSIAFINAIELISLPDLLFPSSASPVPRGPTVTLSHNLAYETRYRINVGGPVLRSRNDSLWRVWDTDSDFLVNTASARDISTDPNSIRHSNGVSSYTAPNLVYATAAEMADANVGNQKFNISWMFFIDSGFQYLVRLHFCDFVSEIPHNLLFNVYINNQSALNSFEVSNKLKEIVTAYVVDFTVDVPLQIEKIFVQIGPTEINNVPPNAFLNGIEIMKLIDVEFTNKKKMTALVVTVTCLGVLLLLGLLCMLYILKRLSGKKSVESSFSWLPSPMTLLTRIGFSDTKLSARSNTSPRPSNGFGRLLAFSEINDATKNFSESLLLGVGGFGKVYEGVLDNGMVVAVKRANSQSQQGLVEFRNEIEILSKLRHRHLVSLIGYCHEPNEMILVYDFMAGGSLRKHLYGSDLPPLSWKQRLEICIGAAKGLHYLHTGAAETIIHRDVKTSNVLLDENLTAKVADFGLSKLGPALDQTHVSTVVKGSFGYLDPEYFKRQRLTEKSDVYSFGVVMLEVLCGRPAINPALPRDQINIVEWVMIWKKRGQLERVIDCHLIGTLSTESLRKFGETAEKCLAEHGSERPAMGDVLWNLEYSLQLQESFAKVNGDDISTNAINEIPEWVPHVAAEHDNFNIVSDGSDTSSSRVFSQLLDPKGR